MIELIYFSEKTEGKPAYQVIQFNPGEPWSIVDGDELIGCMKKSGGLWNLYTLADVPAGFATEVADLIESQHFNTLPGEIKIRWADNVQEVVVQGDDCYLVICKAGIEFERFEKIFRGFIGEMLKDEWQIRFRVYNSDMSADFEIIHK